MFSLTTLQEMQTEYRLIADEVMSCKHYLRSPNCTNNERKIFTEMLSIATFQKQQINIIIADYLNRYIDISQATQLLKVLR